MSELNLNKLEKRKRVKYVLLELEYNLSRKNVYSNPKMFTVTPRRESRIIFQSLHFQQKLNYCIMLLVFKFHPQYNVLSHLWTT